MQCYSQEADTGGQSSADDDDDDDDDVEADGSTTDMHLGVLRYLYLTFVMFTVYTDPGWTTKHLFIHIHILTLKT